MTSSLYVLGIDIGGTKTALIVGDTTGTVHERVQFPSDAARGYRAMLADIAANAKSLIVKYPAIAAIGASVGGPLDAERGLVMGPPHLPGWDNVPLASDLAEALDLPSRIEHDAKAGALAEWRFGAGRGTTDLVFLTLGTGIGAGIIANGALVRGAANAAGEIGHWRMRDTGPDFYGKPGSLEGIASGAGIAAFARQAFPDALGDLIDARDLSQRAASGDAAANEIIARSGAILGHAAAKLIDLLAPQKLVLGSLATRLGPVFTDAMHKIVQAETLPQTLAHCDIVLGKLGDRIGDIAALSVALEALPQRHKEKFGQ